MKNRRYIISKKAVADLEAIWLYTVNHWPVEQADRYYNLIFDEIAYICKNENAGKSLDHVRKGYKTSKVKSHLIFYKISKDIIEIVRILRERMDTENRLSD